MGLGFTNLVTHLCVNHLCPEFTLSAQIAAEKKNSQRENTDAAKSNKDSTADFTIRVMYKQMSISE